jgi:hypothetical protein
VTILGSNGQPIKNGRVSGKAAIRIMVEEIGDAIGQPRLREFERKVRRWMATNHPGGGTASDWITAMAETIVADDDTRANAGFMKGIRRIREQAAG